MKRLKNKLHNSRGASMIIAMVFMLICLFVGGTVLVAATMNSHHMAHVDKKQDYLLQRSAATLVADQLKMNGSQDLQIVFTQKRVEHYSVTQDMTTGTEKTKLKNVVYNVNAKLNVEDGTVLNPMQRAMCESAILAYKAKIKTDPDVPPDFKITCENFQCQEADGSTTELRQDNFWLDAAPIGPSASPYVDFVVSGDVPAHVEEKLAPGFKAKFYIVSPTAKDQKYDFVVHFDESQLEVRMNAALGVRELPEYEEIEYDENGEVLGKELKESKITITTLTWKNPKIEKGAGV